MSVRCRSASPGVSRTHGTERDHGVVRERPPAVLTDQAVADVGVSVAPGAALEDRVVRVDEARACWARPRPRSSSENPWTPSATSSGTPAANRCAVSRQSPSRSSCDGREQLLRVARDRRDRAAGARHQLDQDPHVLGLVHGETEALRGRRQCRLRVLEARPHLRGPPTGAPRATSQAWTVAIRSSRVRRSVVGSHEATFPTYDRCATHGVRPLADRPPRNRSICGSS